MIYLAYAVAWASTAAAAAYAVKITGSAVCLWSLIFPALIRISSSEKEGAKDGIAEEAEEEVREG